MATGFFYIKKDFFILYCSRLFVPLQHYDEYT